MRVLACNRRLLKEAINMSWGQFEMFPHGLALKLGLHPVTIAHLVTWGCSFIYQKGHLYDLHSFRMSILASRMLE
jgi:hypothetical protein